VHGHIVNEFGFPARKVRLLVNSLDPAGAPSPTKRSCTCRASYDRDRVTTSRHACPHARGELPCRGCSSSSGSRQEAATAVA